MQRDNNYMQALAALVLLDIFNKRTSKNGGWSEIKLDNKSKINIKMRKRMEVPVGFSKWNPKKHKVLFPLANEILHTAKFLQFSLSPMHGEQKEHPHRNSADFWQNKKN